MSGARGKLRYAAASLLGLALCAGCATAPAASTSEKKVLYYRCPMHPATTSDRPGKAIDCGMDLEAVYDHEPVTSDAVRTARVEKGPATRTLRTLGRVVPDEDRVFPVVAGCEGWITRLEPHTATGDRVKKGQPLAIVYGREYATAERSLLYALKAAENPPPALQGDESAPSLTLQEARLYLENLGLGKEQIAEIEKSREVALEVALTAPASGVIVSRSAYPRQRFDRDVELFRIADLTHVWVVVDLPAEDPADVPAGTTARLMVRGRTGALPAVVSGALPRFDAGSRVAKLRLEADNPGLTLRPEMLVDVDLSLVVPDVATVPASAIVEAGAETTVFVERGEGRFEPRPVAIGRRFGDRVEIAGGLTPGESVAVAGAFLLDAERKMRAAGASRAH